MAKNLIINFLLMISISLFFTACNKRIQPPSYASGQVKLLEEVHGYYETKIGIKKDLNIKTANYESLHRLRLWPQNNYNSICFYRPLCLIDTMNNGYFTHSALITKKDLFPLTKPVKYTILKKISTVQYIDKPKIYNDENRKEGLSIIYIPALNTISNKEVGESIFAKINQYKFNKYETRINQKILVHLTNEYGENDNRAIEFDKNYILMKWPEKGYKTICEDNICLIDKNNNNSFTHYAIEEEVKLYHLEKPIKYKAIEKIKFTEDSFKYEALYQGKIGNKIKISYREFIDNTARAAFTQDIEYQLNENNRPTIIGFKGLRIKIIKATNLNIKYSVIKDYN